MHPRVVKHGQIVERMTDEMNLLGGKDIWILFNLFVVAVKTFFNSVVSTLATLSVSMIQYLGRGLEIADVANVGGGFFS